MNKNRQSITIIGSGIIGICCALKLQLQGYDVCLIDKEEPASGCSQGNAGHFATEQVFPLASQSTIKQLPSILLDPNGPLSIKPAYMLKIIPWLVRFLLSSKKEQFERGTQALSNLNTCAMTSYMPLLKAANAQHMLKKDGYLLAFEGKNANKMAETESEKLNPFNITQKVIDKEYLTSLEPRLINCEAAVYFPEINYTTDPEQLALKLFSSFIKNGGKYIQREVLDIEIQDNKTKLITNSDHINVDKLIICAGIFSKQLVDKLGIKVPLDTERGYHLMLNQHGLLSRPVAFAQRKFIITPMLKGTRLAGTVEFAGTRIKPDWNRANMLLQLTKKVLNGVDTSKAQKRWMGFRPSLPDSLPVIDSHPDTPNILFAFGHQHLGLTQAAITADLISDLINGKVPEIDLTPFSISRF